MSQPKYFKSSTLKSDSGRVDSKGGYNAAGVIRDVAVVTAGEALGHQAWLDSVFLSQVYLNGKAAEKGLKARFTHPGLSSDGLGRFLGRVDGFYMRDGAVYGDLHFSRAAHKTPDGNLAAYLMHLADEDPESFGLSIVFEHDPDAEQSFAEEHPDSPDPRNTKNLRHVRLKSLKAVDAVDEPAANPNGLFHRENELFEEANAIASYMVGLSDEQPVISTLGIDPDRARAFMDRFLDIHNLEITEKTMADEIKVETNEDQVPETLEALETPEVSAATEEEDDTTQESLAETTPEETDEELSEGREEAAEFLEEFGTEGLILYAEGKSREEVRTALMEKLRAENESLRQKLSAAFSGEETPIDTVSSELASEEDDEPKGLASKLRLPPK